MDGRPAQPIAEPTTAAPSAAIDPAPVSAVADPVAHSALAPLSARETLAAYLAGAVYLAPDVANDSLEWCPPPAPDAEVDEGWEPDEYIAIERPRVLDIRGKDADSSATSVDVMAEFVRLVDVTRGDSGWVARVSTVTDTLKWSLLRRPSGAWAVCGPGWDNFGGGSFLVNEAFARRGEINTPQWLPAGGSWELLARIADSVRAR